MALKFPEEPYHIHLQLTPMEMKRFADLMEAFGQTYGSATNSSLYEKMRRACLDHEISGNRSNIEWLSR